MIVNTDIGDACATFLESIPSGIFRIIEDARGLHILVSEKAWDSMPQPDRHIILMKFSLLAQRLSDYGLVDNETVFFRAES